MSKEERKVPELRFKGFHDDWEQRKLGDIGSVAMNRRIFKDETSSNGEIPFYKIGTFGKKANAFINKEKFEEYKQKYPYPNPGDTLISASGSIGRTVIYNGENAYYQDSNIVWLKHDGKVDNTFLNQFYNIVKWSGIEGTTIKRLYNKNILDTKITLPDLSEQKEIGHLLNTLDSMINLHQRKINILETLRKVYLNVMFTSKRDSTPRLRFKSFAEVWEQRKLKTITERVRGNDGRMDLPTLTISAGKGWMDQRERFSGNIAGKEQKNYTLLSKNELSYNKGNSKLAKYGVVFKLKNFEEALVPRVYHSFKTTYEANPDFIEYVFATKNPDRELAKLITSGARMDGLLNINFNDFMDIKISIPDKEEQTKISRFLGKVDNIINLQQRKLHRLNKIKQVYLRKMFI